jgi:hypothetical protein
MPTFTANQSFAKVGYPWSTWYVDQMVESGAVGVNLDGVFEVIYGVQPEDYNRFSMGLFQAGYTYYVSMENARILIPLNIGVVRYTDDYNAEWSDIFVCDTTLNTPDFPATVPQPIE